MEETNQETSLIERRKGFVKRLDVELLAAQYDRLDETTKRLGMSKADAIAYALNIWFGMIEPKDDSK